MKGRQEIAEALLQEVLENAAAPRVRLDDSPVGIDQDLLSRIETFLCAAKGGS